MLLAGTTVAAVSALAAAAPIRTAQAEPKQQQPAPTGRPNIIMIISDDTGYGDLGPYGGGVGRGMPTPNIDRLAAEGMTFFSFYAQPSCTPGRAAMQTGRIPNRSGMTTVAFQGQGGGLPAAEWTLASVLKTAGYKTFFTGKWHLGEADYALPNAQGYDEMRYCGLYHLNAYTYADPTWFPDMPAETARHVPEGDQGHAVGQRRRAGDARSSSSTASTSIRPRRAWSEFRSSTAYVEQAALDYLDKNANSKEPIFMSINFMKVHQPNMPHPDYIHKSLSKSKYADSVVELDARIGRIMDKIRSMPSANNTLVFYTTDNGAWQDVYPDAGYTPFRGTKGTLREGGNRVPAIAWMPGRIPAGVKNHEMIGGLDLMATFASVGGAKLPERDRENQPIIFDSYDMTPVLYGKGPSPRDAWFYFTENELSPGAVRTGNYKFLFNLRGDDGVGTGGLAVDTNLGWKGPEKYVATVPQVFDLWQDPQERYDIFMNNFTERTWMGVIMEEKLKEIMATYVKYPPRKVQSYGYTGPITLSSYEKFQNIRELLAKDGFSLPMPTGN